MMRYQEFDVAEMSLSSYVLSIARGAPVTAIPVFPSRAFRHHGIYVNADSGIGRPADLAGRVIGIPEYQLTAVVWIRGILAQHYGVPLDSARYRTGGLDDPGRTEKLQVNAPAGVDVRPIPAGRIRSPSSRAANRPVASRRGTGAAGHSGPSSGCCHCGVKS
jgi:4,5-dihydroxyphthalate decarboxylase